MVRFMQGDLPIPADIWPLVSRKHDFATLSQGRHATSDLYVVELASAKQVTIDGVSIQLNYLNATYPEFFADPDRAQAFWILAQAGDEDALATFFADEWSDTPQQKDEAALLGRIRLTMVTPDSLRRDIEALKSLLPEVLFVSHVNARKPDGAFIKSRARFIEMVEKQVAAAGCAFYNPTKLMDQFGQSLAIEDESTGLAHFTEDFADGVMTDWMRAVIAPMTDAGVLEKGAEPQLRPQVMAACAYGAFVDTRARLNVLVEKGVDIGTLLSETNHAQSDAQSVFSKFSLEAAETGMQPDEWCKLIVGGAKLGLFEAANELTRISPEKLPPHAMLEVAELAETAGDFETAVTFNLMAFEEGASHGAVKAAKASLIQQQDLLGLIPQSERNAFLANLPAAEKAELLHLNGAGFAEALPDAASPEEATQVASYIANAFGIGFAAEVLGKWREAQGEARITASELNAVLDQWVETATNAAEPVDRIHGLNAVMYASPRHGAARRAMRDARKDLVLRIREAGKAGDIIKLDELTHEAAALTSELPELDLWRARLRFKLEEYDAALSLGQAAAAHMPDTLNVWVLLMRAAGKINDHSQAVSFAHKVINLACTRTAAFKTEAEAVLQANLVEV